MATPTCGPPMATPTLTCALAAVGASAKQARSALDKTIHLNPRILMPRLQSLRLLVGRVSGTVIRMCALKTLSILTATWLDANGIFVGASRGIDTNAVRKLRGDEFRSARCSEGWG